MRNPGGMGSVAGDVGALVQGDVYHVIAIEEGLVILGHRHDAVTGLGHKEHQIILVEDNLATDLDGRIAPAVDVRSSLGGFLWLVGRERDVEADQGRW